MEDTYRAFELEMRHNRHAKVCTNMKNIYICGVARMNPERKSEKYFPSSQRYVECMRYAKTVSMKCFDLFRQKCCELITLQRLTVDACPCFYKAKITKFQTLSKSRLGCAPQLQILHLFSFSFSGFVLTGDKKMQSCDYKKTNHLIGDFHAMLGAANRV